MNGYVVLVLCGILFMLAVIADELRNIKKTLNRIANKVES